MIDIIEQKLSANRKLVENELEKYYSNADSIAAKLKESQKYGLLGGGKRIRAFLLLEICRLLGADTKAALPYACALEMIHASSLIHDDLPCMDNDELRRGKPSTHKLYGETLALLAGDALMIKAFEVAVANPYLPTKINAEAVRVLAKSAGDDGMLAGQTLDTACPDKPSDLEELITLHMLKTGKLINASAELAFIAADVDKTDERYFSVLKYCESVGLAFQIIDDILDFEEGKNDNNSFLSFMPKEEAFAYAEMLTETGVAAISSLDDGTLYSLAQYLTKRKY